MLASRKTQVLHVPVGFVSLLSLSLGTGILVETFHVVAVKLIDLTEMLGDN
jgi:hypothetical protein